MVKKIVKSAAAKAKNDNETGARKELIEELFYDFNRSKSEVYKMNLMRGIFFGFGTVLGGTILIGLLAWVLSFFINLPGIGDSIEQVQKTIQSDKK